MAVNDFTDAPPSENPFEQFDPDRVGALPSQSDEGITKNPFAQFNPFPTEDPRPAAPKTTTSGVFARSAARSLVPSIGSLPAMGAGAELGASVGRFAGPWGAVGGAVAGGLVGGFGGATAIAAAQDWALSKLPDTWQEAIGQDDRQRRLDEAQHPTAAFLGGLAPFALTMRPGAIPKGLLPENATALQRIMANPATSRLFGGALMGGMELGQEVVHGAHPDWTHVALATGFGLVFNRPTRIGEGITELGARPTRGLLGREAPAAETAPAPAAEAPPPLPAQTQPIPSAFAPGLHPDIRWRPEPTIAQAADTKVMGPGITEDVFHGTHQQSEPSALSAQDQARTETSVLGPRPEPDLHAIARRIDPDTFAEYDALTRRRDALRASAQALAETGMAQTPAALAKHLAATEADLDALAPQVASAYRHAEERAGIVSRETVAPDAVPPAAVLPGRPIEEQRAAIAADVARQLLAAGQGPEYAKAAAAVVAARYIARAQRMQGALGAAEDLYAREGARIVGGRGTAPVAAAAPPQPRPAPTTRAELAAYLREGGKVEAAPAAPAAPAGAIPVRAEPEAEPVQELFQQDQAPPFYSAVERSVQSAKQAKASPAQWLATIRNTPGVKPEELQWLGLEDWLKEQAEPVTREQIADYVRANKINVKEVQKGEHPHQERLQEIDQELIELIERREDVEEGGYDGWERTVRRLNREIGAAAKERDNLLAAGGDVAPTKFASRVLPGGENYRELLLTLPPKDTDYRSSHFEEPNILAHVRFNDRTIDGKRTLFVEEVQSDWHQTGRKVGYRGTRASDADVLRLAQQTVGGGEALWAGLSPEARQLHLREARDSLEGGGVPDAPFKTTWPELAMKRMIRYAAENGYDRIAWTPGEVQAARYDLSKQISELHYAKNDDGTYWLQARQQDSGAAIRLGENVTSHDLADHVGKEIADKILAGAGQSDRIAGRNATVLESPDLKVGGEGMAGFYDKILPTTVNKLVKKFGAKVEQSKMPAAMMSDAEFRQAVRQEGNPNIIDVHTLDLTDQLRDAATEQGFPLFQGARGKILLRDGARPLITLMKDANASTFIHESGHDFLAQMMRDAEHPAAPAQLRDDATTIIDWLGVRSAEDIKRRQHETFARGFEQYMREGVAPSQELASVFAKFKDWLLQIYQSLKGLGQPISDDIRRVFDRMLTAEPQRTVIAPERPQITSLAELHEGEAAGAHPRDADAAWDLVTAEKQRHIEDLPEEVTRELDASRARIAAETRRPAQGQPEGGPGAGPGAGEAAQPAGEAGAQPAGAGHLGPGGGRPEPVAAGGGGGGRAGTLERGAGDAGAEGAAASAEPGAGPGRAARDAAGDQPLAPGPASLVGPRDSPFLDRAGNIRLDNIRTTADVKQAIRDAAARNEDFIGDRRGVVTDGQVLDVAKAMGDEHLAPLLQRSIGQAYSAEEIKFLEIMLNDSAKGVAAASQKAVASDAAEDWIAYIKAKSRIDMIQSTFARATAESGRAQRALRRTDELWTPETSAIAEHAQSITGMTFFQMKEQAKLIAALDTPEKINKFAMDSRKRSFGRMILEYWINGLISGPATHTTYMVGNTILSLEKAGPETAVAAGIGALRKAMGREGETVRLGEVAAQIKGMGQGLAPGLKAAIEALRTGVTTLLPGETTRTMPLQPGAELAHPAVLDEVARFSDVMGSAFGVVRGIRDGIIAHAGLLAAGGIEGAPQIGAQYSHLGAIPDIAIRGVPVVPLGSTIRLPGRAIAAIHSFFRSVNYSMEKNAIAYRTASEEGLSGPRFDARVAEVRNNPTPDQMEQARFNATESTLMGQGSEFTRALARLTNTNIFGFPLLKFIDPFVHISGNIINEAIIKRTPIGILAPELRADLMGKNGSIAQDTAQARMLVGTAIAIGFGSLAAEGYASGSGPKDPKEAAVWRLAGNQAHSVRIGDIWYDVHRLGPLGMLMGIGADLYEVAHLAKDEEYLDAAAHFQHAVTQNILDESMMRGPADLIKAIEDPGRYGDAYIRNVLSSFVPMSVGMAQIARSLDPYTRQARTVTDAIVNKIPGLSQGLLPKRDIWGDAIPNKEVLGIGGLSALYEQRVSHDPVNKALLDLSIFPAQPQRKIRNAELTDQQYDDYTRIAGRMTKLRLDAIVRSPDWQTWPNHVKHDVIQATIRQSREVASGVMMGKYPQIVKDAVEAKMDRFRD